MRPESSIPSEVIKELATAAIAKRRQESGKHARRVRPPRVPERTLLELTKALSDFYGFAAVPHTNKEHRLMADLVAESWVPLAEYERQVRQKDEAQQRVKDLQRELIEARARMEQSTKEAARLKAVLRTALARLILDTSEKHVKEEWAVVLLKRIEAARDILKSEAAVDAEA